MKPLVELHLHLDGSLRIPTMLEIASSEGIRLPATDEAGLRQALSCGTVRESLAQYLEHFAHTTAVMQSRKALTRIACELIEDCAADGLKYVEVRFMPSLHTSGGLAEEEVMEAVLEGMTIGGLRHGLGGGLIVCSMRHVDPSVTGRMVDLAIRYRRNGVVAVDLAGDDNLPALEHAPHFRRAKEAGLHVTIHAAEGGPPERVMEAMEIFGAERIGHGIQALRDPKLQFELWTRRVGVEACLSSNVQTKAAASYSDHAARAYMEFGGLICLNTDNRLLAGTTMVHELALARLFWKLQPVQVRRLIWNAIEMAFISKEAKTALHAELRADAVTDASPPNP
ncbi:MAG: adenosine deaminase [Patescibacteria group bacterium]